MYQLKILQINTLSPHENLAFESSLYEQLEPEQIIVLLWQNTDAVIIGRAQNPWMEVNLNYITEHHIPLIRRSSGGGTVYHDLGNINFTLMAHKPLYKNTIANHIVNQTLNDLGFNTSVNQRNDILLHTDNQSFKISGSAYRETPRKGLHHGTILVNANIPKLKEALHPHNNELVSSCIKSLRVPVINLNTIQPELNMSDVMTSLVTHFNDYFADSCSTEVQTMTQLPCTEFMTNESEKLRSWAWLFGKTPKFTQYLPDTLSDQPLEGMLEVNQGIITTLALNCPAVTPETKTVIQQALINQPYHKATITNVLNQLDPVLGMNEIWPHLKTMLIKQID